MSRRREIPGDARESVWRARDGHAIRRIDLEPRGAGEPGRAARGSILFCPGRGDFYEKYLETLCDWRDAGFQVCAIDWRGQAGSGRLGKDRFTGHIEDFSVWVDDLAEFWKDWRAQSRAPRILAGHSMGGHLALRAVVEGRVDPDGLVLIAPMLGFVGPLPNALGQRIARAMCAIGDPARPAWKWSEKPGEVPEARQALLTHDQARYEDELFWRERRSELAMGPGSWRWVERAYASMRMLAEKGALEKVDIPVLILAAQNDRLVSFKAIEKAARRLPKARLVAFGEEAHHEILRESDDVRARALREIDDFARTLERAR